MAKEYSGNITPELCKSSSLLFYPKSEAEAVFIQEQLFKFGCAWGSGATVSYVAGCVDKGMICDKGTLYWNPNPETGEFVCTAKQFDQDYLPPEQKFLLDLFNKISTRLDGIDARLDRIEAQLGPAEIDKPQLPRPGKAP